jgi:predicted nicotinamide N-methyase
MTPEGLVRSATSWERVPLVGEITLLTTARPSGLWDLWHQTGRDGPPFWAFPWAGGQALARYVLDNPGTVRGRRVLDVASGSGLVAIAAAKAEAASVVATDIDPNAVAAIAVNAAANGVPVAARAVDMAAGYSGDSQVVLAGDVFYERQLAELALGFLLDAARSGADVLVADPGRPYFPALPALPALLPADSLIALTSYEVPVLTAIEDAPVKTVTVYRLTGAGKAV